MTRIGPLAHIRAVQDDRDADKITLAQSTMRRAQEAGAARASLVLYHRDEVKVTPLVEGEPLVVGRAWPADIVVADPSLSRRHAQFTWVQGGVKVEDLDSTNGTYLRGERVKEALLPPGETVTLGSVAVSVNLAGASDGLVKGIESYERFSAHLADELLRARTFRRGLAFVMLRAIGREDTHVSRWAPRVRASLRPVDRMALYGPGAILVLMPETDRDRAVAVASELVRGERLGEPSLVAGIALWGGSAEELVDKARSLARRARHDTRVVVEGEGEPAQTTEPLFVSPRMRALRELVDRVALASVPVLIRGETGSGKEIVARTIHKQSQRSQGPLRSVNCGAIPATLIESLLFGHEKGAFTGAERTTPGLFEQASGGTLFLDEVGELAPPAQAALLRVLETRRLMRVGGTEEIEVDVRVICATHRDLDGMVAAGNFRQDLLYRMNTVTLEIPPLRDHKEDLDALIDRFLDEASRASGGVVRSMDEAARGALHAHDWPGNVRELRNVIERAVVMCAGDKVGLDDLPEMLRAPRATVPEAGSTELPPALEGDDDFKDRVRRYETQLILDALRRSNGNQTQAAKLLRMPLRTLVHKIRAYGIRKQFDVDE